MKYLLCILIFACSLIAGAPLAKSDLGGEVPSPGNCDYPAQGTWGLDGPGVYHWLCVMPVEENGSRHTCITLGAATQLTIGVSFPIISASVQTPTGIIEGLCYYACPDLSPADWPNPPGAWKSYIVPHKCKPIGSPPLIVSAAPPQPVGPTPMGAPTPPPPYTPPATAPLDPMLPNPVNTDQK